MKLEIPEYQFSFEKTPTDSWPISIDYSDRIGEGNTLVSEGTTITAYNLMGGVNASVIDSGKCSVGTSSVKVWVQAGVNGQEYVIFVSARTTDAKQLDEAVLMRVKTKVIT